jgi:nucleotide-binding universal stress UspA family protein
MGRREIGQVTNRVILSSVISRVIGYSKIDVLVVPEKAQIKWKRILFATDGSLGSMRAQSQAINFAKAYGEKVDIVNVVSVTEEFEALAPQVLNELIKKAHQVLEKIQAEFASQGIETRVFVKEGEPANKIIQLAQDENVDAIILGSHGRTGLSRLLMGSVTESVVAVGNCPVMVVHPG